MGKINKTKSWFFEKMKKIDKSLARLIKKKRKRPQINKIINEKEVKTDITEIQSLRILCTVIGQQIEQPRRN